VVGHHREVAVPLPIGHLVHPDAVDLVQATVVDVVGDDPNHDAGHSLARWAIRAGSAFDLALRSSSAGS
jgi:hypothetical protein